MVVFIDYALEEGAEAPKQATEGSNGLDLTAFKVEQIGADLYEYDTGVSIAIPPGYVGLLFPRSSISKTDMHLRNCVGVIDSDYRGTIRARFLIHPKGDHLKAYRRGDKVCQLLIIPQPKVILCKKPELSETQRGSGGFGSTGK